MGVQNGDAASPDASDDVTLDENTEAQVDSGAESGSAESSTAAEGEPSLLSVVRDVVDKSRGAPASPTGDDESDRTTAASETPPDNEHYSDVPFNKHPRFQALVAEKNGYKAEAERFAQMTSFLEENGVKGEDAVTMLNWAALRVRDPQKLWSEQLKPFVQNLLLEIGEILPPDLKQRVAAGQLTADAAKLVAKERAQTNVAKGQLTFTQAQIERRQAAERQQAVQAAADAVNDVVVAWETAAKKDPDYARKEKDLRKEVLYLQNTEGRPTTPDGVKAQLAKAWKSVNATYAARRPAPRAIIPVNGGSTGGTAPPPAKSLLDIVERRGAGH
jgi:hypothetical protein